MGEGAREGDGIYRFNNNNYFVLNPIWSRTHVITYCCAIRSNFQRTASIYTLCVYSAHTYGRHTHEAIEKERLEVHWLIAITQTRTHTNTHASCVEYSKWMQYYRSFHQFIYCFHIRYITLYINWNLMCVCVCVCVLVWYLYSRCEYIVLYLHIRSEIIISFYLINSFFKKKISLCEPLAPHQRTD